MTKTWEKPRIAIIDDDISIREALTGFVQSLGCAPESFASAVDFVAANPGDRYACLIVDIQMPHMSGLELLDWLKRKGRSGRVVLMSSYASPQSRATALDSGALEFLEKPFDLGRLIDVLQLAIDEPDII